MGGSRAAPAAWLGLLRTAGRAALRLPRALRGAACLAWMGGIWWLSSRTFRAPTGPEDLLRVVANLVHAPLYGGLSLLFAAWFAAPPRGGARPSAWRAWSAAALGATLLYALVDELHQSSVAGRHPSALDLVTDTAGAASALWIALYLARDGATDRGLLRRLAAGALLCLAAATLASFVGRP